MIELPEAFVLAKQIQQTLTGKQIRQVTANYSPHKFAWFTDDPQKYNGKLVKKTIQGADSFGNHVEIQAEGMLLIISTPIHYHSRQERPPKKHQLFIEFEDQTAISCTVQMWGALACIKQGEDSGIPDYPIARKKPSPLSNAFDRAYFDSLFNSNTDSLSTKAFLATEQRIPGLGNGVLQDILWTAKIHPRRKMADLSSEEISQMYCAVKSVLQMMAEQGGRDTETDLFGCPGGYKTILSKNTVLKPCPACSTIITKEAYLGGTVYVCKGCQKI
jgi:formamidopyrimidine-DNA glycosylase